MRDGNGTFTESPFRRAVYTMCTARSKAMFEPLLLFSIINMITEIVEPVSDEKYPGRHGLCIHKDTLWEMKKTLQVEDARRMLELDFPLGGVSVGFSVRQ